MPDSLNMPSEIFALEPALRLLQQTQNAIFTPHWLTSSALLLDQAGRDGKFVATMIIDIEEIAQIRQILGETAAEKVMRKVALRLADVIDNHTVAVHCARDQFLIMAGGLATPIEAHTLARRIEALVALPVTIEDWDMTVSPIIAISFYPDHAVALPQLLQRGEALNSLRREAAAAANRLPC
jgi:GGDEF domain-containing protein